MRTGALNLSLTLVPADFTCQPPPTHRASRFTPLRASTAQFLLAGPAVGAGSRPGARCGRADAPPVVSVPGWAAVSPGASVGRPSPSWPTMETDPATEIGRAHV